MNSREDAAQFRRCPRCSAELFEVGRGALSRATRDDEGPGVEVCGRCGTREGFFVRPLAAWPLSIEQLLEEERALITLAQSGEITIAAITPDDARELLGGDPPQPPEG